MSKKMTKGKSKRRKSKAQGFKVIQPDVAGIDLGSREHYVCCPANADGTPNVRSFATTTPELNKLCDWLHEQKVTSVAMESTGVYWIPLYEILASRNIEVLLVNARSISNVPGRKTDVQDCQWLQKLHSCGLLKGSFRPEDNICALRSLVREKNNMELQKADWLRRMQKSLDQMNICVHHAVSDISGATGMAIIRAIVAGERNPAELAQLRDRRCRKTVEQIAEELTGNWRHEHLVALEMAVSMYDHIACCIAKYETEIETMLKALQPPENENLSVPEVADITKRRNIKNRGQETMRCALFKLAGVDLTTINSIGVTTAETIISELGTDLSCFRTEHHFVSYLKLSPKMAITGGKPIKGKRIGSTTTRLGAAFRMAAVTLRNSKCALGAEYRRISRKKGASIAVFAMARKLAILVYRLLRHGQAFVDEGVKAFEERFRAAKERACRRFAKELGLIVLEQKETHG